MTDRKVTIRSTKDGRNWGDAKERSLGEVGEYNTRTIATRLGLFRSGAIRIRNSSPVVAPLLGLLARTSPAGN